MNFLWIFILAFIAAPTEPFKFGCTAPYSCKPIKTCSQGHKDGNLENQVLFQCGHGHLCCPPSNKQQQEGIAEPWVDENIVPDSLNPSTTTNPTKISAYYEYDKIDVKIAKHRNRNLLPERNCGMTLNNKIVGGDASAPGEFPWMALIGFRGFDGSITYVCGGTLISDRYVLTAAHCLNREDAVLSQVRLGEFDLTTVEDCVGVECYPAAVDIPVVKIIQHNGWNNRTYQNDIALLRLNSSTLELGLSTISPICLPLNVTGLNLTEGYKYEAAGWGLTGWLKKALSNVLKKTNLGGISLEHCNEVVCPESMTKQSFCPIKSTQICVQGVRKRDVCKGDSGGPLMTFNTVPTYQIGITSFKTTEICGEENVPSVFTSIEPFLTWILDNLEP